MDSNKKVTSLQVRIAARIKLLREGQGLSQLDLADSVGVERTTITNIEGGLYWPQLKHFTSLCRSLKATPNELLGFGDELPEPPK